MSSLDKYFEVLELNPGASLDEIKQAYRDLAQIWHPDRYSHNPRLRSKAEERFKNINEAYQKLSSEGPNLRCAQTSPPKPSTREDGTNSELPRSPPPTPQPQTHTKRHWGWTFLSIIGFVLIRSCFKALETPSHPTYSYQTYPTPIPPTVTPHADVFAKLKQDNFDQASTVASTEGGHQSKLTIPESTPAQTPPPSKPPDVEVSADDLKLVQGLAVKDKDGFISVHNNSTWTLTSVDFVIEVYDTGGFNPQRRKMDRYHAVNSSGSSPYATSHFTFAPFDNDEIVKALHIQYPHVAWKIVSAQRRAPN